MDKFDYIFITIIDDSERIFHIRSASVGNAIYRFYDFCSNLHRVHKYQFYPGEDVDKFNQKTSTIEKIDRFNDSFWNVEIKQIYMSDNLVCLYNTDVVTNLEDDE